MKIQDVGLGIGVFFICIGIGLGLAVYFAEAIDLDLSSTQIPYIEQSPYLVGGFGVFLTVISLIGLARSS